MRKCALLAALHRHFETTEIAHSNLNAFMLNALVVMYAVMLRTYSESVKKKQPSKTNRFDKLRPTETNAGKNSWYNLCPRTCTMCSYNGYITIGVGVNEVATATSTAILLVVIRTNKI